MTIVWLLYIFFNSIVINKQTQPLTLTFTEYYKSLNQTQKEKLHSLGLRYPDELIVLNMIFDI